MIYSILILPFPQPYLGPRINLQRSLCLCNCSGHQEKPLQKQFGWILRLQSTFSLQANLPASQRNLQFSTIQLLVANSNIHWKCPRCSYSNSVVKTMHWFLNFVWGNKQCSWVEHKVLSSENRKPTRYLQLGIYVLRVWIQVEHSSQI